MTWPEAARPAHDDRAGARVRSAARLVLLAVLWRRGLAAALVVAAAAGIAVVAVGPIWNRASLESNLRETLRTVGSGAGLRLFATDGPDADDVSVTDAQRSWALTPQSLPGYPVRVLGIRVGTSASTAEAPLATAQLAVVYRSGVCRAVRIVQGRCARGADEVMVSRDVAQLPGFGYRVGAEVTVGGVVDSLTYRIAGVYAVDDPGAPYWFGLGFPARSSGGGGEPLAFDPLLTTFAGMQRFSPTQPASVSSDYVLDADRVRLADVPRVQAAVAALRQRYVDQERLRVSSGFGRVVAEVQRRQAATDLGGTLVTLQLALLAWAVLFQIATDAAEARAAEVALLTLRGATRRRTAVFTFTEPLVLLLIAVPIGIVAGYLAVLALAPTVLLPGTPVLLEASAVLAALGAFTGGALAVGLAGRRVLGRTVLQLWQRTERSAEPLRPLAVDLAVAGAAVAAVVALLLVGRTAGPVLLLAPGLLVAAVGLLGVRLVPRVVQRFVAPTRTALSVPLFLAVRQVARRPAGLRLVAVLAVALGLASFAGVAQGAAASDRAARAAADVGAPRTYRVLDSTPGRTIAAVERADPAGSWAMAATTWSPSGGTITGEVLAVQADRYAAVGLTASGGPTVAELGRRLGAPVAAVRFRGDALAVRITASSLTGRPVVAVDLIDADGARRQVTAGALRGGTADYSATVPCIGGCELVGLAWQRGVGRGEIGGTALLTAITAGSGGTTSAVRLPLTAGAWVAAPPVSGASDRVTVGAQGVRDRFASDGGGFGGVQLASRPLPLPVIATASAVLRGDVDDVPRMEDLAGDVVPVRVTRFAPLLPVVLGTGAVVDLAALDYRLGSLSREVQPQVWLGTAAPADALRRLAAAGLRLRPLDSTAAEQARLARQGPALSLLLLQACGAAGAVLAMLATAISIASTARRRSYEAAAMLAMGLRRAQVGGAAVLEQVLLLAAAVVLGVPAGWVAAVVTLPVLPRFDTATPIALIVVPSPLPALVLAAAFLVLVLIASVLGALAVLRSAGGSRLREGEE